MIVLQSQQSRLEQRKKGFTLTEIAIVLGIIGLILGAIWVAAASVYNNQKVSKANTEILNVVQGTRSLFSTSAVTGESENDMTAILCSAAIFPSDSIISCTTPQVNDPWNGAFTVKSTSQLVANTGDAFTIEMTNIPQAGCIALLSAVGGTGHDAGLLYAGANTAYTVNMSATIPLSIGAATTECSSPTANSVYATFKLKG